MKIRSFTVLLEDGTVGKKDAIDYVVEVGDTVDVHLHDENGMLIKVNGTIKEIIDEELVFDDES